MLCQHCCDIRFPIVDRERGTNIRQLSDLARTDEEHLCEIFMSSMDAIFQYSVLDVQEQLQGFSMKTLQSLHKLLCDKIQVCHSQYKDRRAISRKVKGTIIPDITYMGYSLINKNPCIELDKIFCPRGETYVTECDSLPSATEYQELLLLISNLTDRVTSLEKKLKDCAKSRSGSAAVSCECRGPTSVNLGPDIPDQRAVTAPPDLSEDQNSPDSDHEDDLEPTLMAACASQPVLVQPAGCGEPINRRTGSSGALKAASPGVIKRKAVYIGGISGTNTSDDVLNHLHSIKAAKNTIISNLTQKEDWRSFKVEVPAQRYQHVLDRRNWADGVVVRPFRDATAGRERKGGHRPKRGGSSQPRPLRGVSSVSWSRRPHGGGRERHYDHQQDRHGGWQPRYRNQRQHGYREYDYRDDYTNEYDAGW